MPIMQKRSYTLSLATPAFLGGALQSAEWRTPPLKALLREWWRVAVAREAAYDIATLKARETSLFGTAADEGNAKNEQSRIRLALKNWPEGKLTQWPDSEPRVTHQEVKDRNTGKPRQVGAELYLGYGPLQHREGRTHLNDDPHRTALFCDQENVLALAFPSTDETDLTRALTLIHWFGTIGGRSRNGWGSLHLRASRDSPVLSDLSRVALEMTNCLLPIADCLSRDWPHAVGLDKDGPLVWQSNLSFNDWRDALSFLAKTKIDFRTEPAAMSFAGKADGMVGGRHLLGYPVTHHAVGGHVPDKSMTGWVERLPNGRAKEDRQGYIVQAGRLAGQIRFKVLKTASGLQVQIAHLPTRPHKQMLDKLTHRDREALMTNQLDTWQQVHRHLDAQATLTRLR